MCELNQHISSNKGQTSSLVLLSDGGPLWFSICGPSAQQRLAAWLLPRGGCVGVGNPLDTGVQGVASNAGNDAALTQRYKYNVVLLNVLTKV